MGHQCHHHRKKERARLACIIFLFITMLLIILLVVLYFSVFKPKDPSVQVPMMQIMSYSTVGSPPGMTSVSLGLDLQVYISNPNRGVFYMEGASTASMLFGAAQVGSTSLPITTPIPSLSSITFGIAIAIQNPISLNMTTLFTDPTVFIPLPISTAITISGHVTTAGALSHHSLVVSTCDVNVAIARPHTYIRSYVCKKSRPVNE